LAADCEVTNLLAIKCELAAAAAAAAGKVEHLDRHQEKCQRMCPGSL